MARSIKQPISIQVKGKNGLEAEEVECDGFVEHRGGHLAFVEKGRDGSVPVQKKVEEGSLEVKRKGEGKA